MRQSKMQLDIKKFILPFAILTFLLALNGCDLFFINITEQFGSDLRGTWKSVKPSYPGYDAVLVIDFNEIIISGYQGDIGSDPESKRPFIEFTKDSPLKGYSDTDSFLEDNYNYYGNNGTLYIKLQNKGVMEINYTYYKTKNSPQKRYLYISFADWEDTLMLDD